MTVIIVNAEKLQMLRIIFAFGVGLVVWMMSKMMWEIYDSNKKRERLQEAKQLYTARKRKFEGDEKGWKKWRDVNYKITDLVEDNSYY